MTIILLSGKRFSGKDTIAAKLPNLTRVSIADTMKKEFMKLHPTIDLFDREQKEAHRSDLMKFTHQYPLSHWIKLTPYQDRCIVTDIRTHEEIQFLKSKFQDVKVVRISVGDSAREKRGWKYDPKYDDTYLETELDNYEFDLVVKNEVLEDIPKVVKEIEKILNHDPNFMDLGYGFRRTITKHNGVPFMNLVPLMATPKYRNLVIDNIITKLSDRNIIRECTHIVAVESSGFPLGAWLGQKLDIGFTMARKPGKLPPPVIEMDYSMEYREKDKMEIQADSFPKNAKVIIVDDIIATGGTIIGAMKLVQKLGCTVVGVAAYGELVGLMKHHEMMDSIPLITFAQIQDYTLFQS